MAKKKVEISLDHSPMRDAPLTGDVEIDYAGETIYATSETNQIRLLTENKVCLDDIIVDYVKPEPIVNITYNGDVTGLNVPATAHPGELIEIYGNTLSSSIDDFNIYVGTNADNNEVPYYAEVNIKSTPHRLVITFYAPNEDITVTVNTVQ